MKNRHTMRLFLAITLIFFLSACGRQGEIDNQLQQAEAVMAEHPDSALSIIQAIDPATISRNELQARYALLLSQAKDKNWIDETNDSLISIAANHYSNGDNKYYDMLSQYYMGRVKYNNKDYTKSLIAYLRALELAEEQTDHFWAGMSAREISYIYIETFNSYDENVYAQIEYEHFKICNKQPYLNYAIIDLARSYFNNDDFDNAIRISSEFIDTFNIENDSYLITKALRIKGVSHIRKQEYIDAMICWQMLTKLNLATTEDSTYMGLTHVYLKEQKQALNIIDKLPIDENVQNNYLKYQLYKLIGENEKSFKALINLYDLTNIMLEDRINYALSSSISNYYDGVHTSDKLKLKHSRTFLILSIVIALITIFLIVTIALYIHKKQQTKINQHILLAEELEIGYRMKKTECHNAQESIRNLLTQRFESIDEICQLIYTNSNTKQKHRKISEAVSNFVNQLSSDPKKIKELEKLADEHCDNIYSQFKNDLPGLKDADYQLFLFSVFGFSNTAIAVLINEESVTPVYNRKRHLKDKIKSLSSDKADKYLAELR